ncbi:hypothetical protein ACMFMG_012029, partial [Clarireedia jacksonii]
TSEAKFEAGIKVYENKVRDLEDEEDLMRNYKELSEAQNHFIKAQKSRISELEMQSTGHVSELARTYQVNQELSATIHYQQITIGELQKRVAEGASNLAAITSLFQDRTLYVSPCLDSKAPNYAVQNDIFLGSLSNNQDIKPTTEADKPATRQKFTMADNISPASSQWRFKESASPDGQMKACQSSYKFDDYGVDSRRRSYRSDAPSPHSSMFHSQGA